MSVPKRRQTSGRKARRNSHSALKPVNLISVGDVKVPHGLKKAVEASKKLKTRS